MGIFKWPRPPPDHCPDQLSFDTYSNNIKYYLLLVMFSVTWHAIRKIWARIRAIVQSLGFGGNHESFKNSFSCLFYFSCPAFLDISGPLFWSSVYSYLMLFLKCSYCKNAKPQFQHFAKTKEFWVFSNYMKKHAKVRLENGWISKQMI